MSSLLALHTNPFIKNSKLLKRGKVQTNLDPKAKSVENNAET
jgi:hypothetical protein